jgi:hypothetical protein
MMASARVGVLKHSRAAARSVWFPLIAAADAFAQQEISTMSAIQAASRHAIWLAALAALSAPANAETSAPAGPTIAIQPLTKYVLPDKTASVMLPAGWQVTQTGPAFIRAEGPNGELAMFGVTVPAHDAAGAAQPPPAPLNQSYSADAADKLNQSIQWVRAANNLSPVRVIQIYSKDAFTAPPEFGECSKMTATLGMQGGVVLDAEADLCSMPKDSAGNYTNFLKLIAISPALAKTERGTLEAVLASYVLNWKAVQQHAAQPVKQPTQMAAAPSAKRSTKSGAATPNPVTPQGRQSLQQQIDSEIKAGGFSPQMVAAMRAQANRMAATTMGPAMRSLAASNQAVDYFDRTTLRGQIPVSIANQGTFWLDTN